MGGGRHPRIGGATAHWLQRLELCGLAGALLSKGPAANKVGLEYYSQVFDCVEVDSTFHSIPSPVRTAKWAKVTSAHFRFTAKLPKSITHEKAFYNVERELEMFYAAMAPLGEKLSCMLIQLPPSITYKSGLAAFKNFMGIADPRFRYAIEVRHNSWFNNDIYQYPATENVCLVWNPLDTIQAPPTITSDFIYMRLIGDRSISEHDFGRIQKDRTAEMEIWADKVRKGMEKVGLKIGIVAANNHYAGFSPAAVNIFCRMVGLPELQFDVAKKSVKLSGFGCMDCHILEIQRTPH